MFLFDVFRGSLGGLLRALPFAGQVREKTRIEVGYGPVSIGFVQIPGSVLMQPLDGPPNAATSAMRVSRKVPTTAFWKNRGVETYFVTRVLFSLCLLIPTGARSTMMRLRCR